MSDITIVINLLLAFLLGGVVGWFREKEGKSAGLRTHILVSVGSALFMIISGNMMFIVNTGTADRIAAGVVTGIGFIGAGCILRAEGNIRGMTTAASIWITAAIGLAAGTSMYLAAVVVTFITYLTLEPLGYVEKRIKKYRDSPE
ncbi:MAG: MgtC/SapB family protein [bacterium]